MHDLGSLRLVAESMISVENDKASNLPETGNKEALGVQALKPRKINTCEYRNRKKPDDPERKDFSEHDAVGVISSQRENQQHFNLSSQGAKPF